jgi:hypothetical protein
LHASAAKKKPSWPSRNPRRRPPLSPFPPKQQQHQQPQPVSAPIPPDSEFAFLLGARCEPDFGYVNDNTGDDDDGGNALKKTLMPTADKLEGLAAKMLAAKAAKKN